jgi:cold-inducible RNA-binding protein
MLSFYHQTVHNGYDIIQLSYKRPSALTLPSTPLIGLTVFLSELVLTLKEQYMDAKLYVGNMSYNTSEDDLRGLFAQAGAITSVALIKDRTTGMSKGFAFVEMDSRTSAQKAITMFNEYMLNERKLAVSFARPREERSGFQHHNKRRKRDGHRRRY